MLPVKRKNPLDDFYFEDGCHHNTAPNKKTIHVKQTTRLSVVIEAEFFQHFTARLCFKNWQHWALSTISSIWHLSVGGYDWVQFLLQGLMERSLSFFSSSVMKPIKKGIMVEKFFFYKSKFDYLAIRKEFCIVL